MEKSLLPTRKGKWSSEEDKLVKVAVTLFGTKNWHKISSFVPGRTATQCRERWVNCLDPKLNRGKWTEEEDEKLREAIAEHGYSWSKVASHLSCRTDNQCSRRWKSLYPHQVVLLQEARRLRKEAIVGNFVDWESERPALVVGPILALPDISLDPESDIVAPKKKRKAKQKKSDAERQPKRRRKGSERSSGEVCRQENETVCEIEANNGREERMLELEWCSEIQDNVKEKQRRRRKSVAETSNNSTGLKKLKPRRKVNVARSSGDVCSRLENEIVCEIEPNNGGEKRMLELEWCSEIQDTVKEKQKRRGKSVSETSNNSTGLKKLKPRRKVSAVVPMENQDAPN